MRSKTERRGPGDRRAVKQRRADKLKAQLAAQDRDRRATATSIVMGPLSFDSAMARALGWKNTEIDKFWEQVTPILKKIANRVQRRHPDLAIRQAP